MRPIGSGLALCASCILIATVWSNTRADGQTWIVNGSELIEALKGDHAPEASDQELKRALSTARGGAYVTGVADASQNRDWCGAENILPHEMTDCVFTGDNLVLAPEVGKGFLKQAMPDKASENG